MISAGRRFRQAMHLENPLQVVGAINAYSAILAEKSGFRAIYLSGGGVAASSLGVPDLGITTLNDVLEDVRRITSATSLPLLVDVDTGWGSSLNIQRTTVEMIKAGAAGMHIEDQIDIKRCGHRPDKRLVSKEVMNERIQAAVSAKTDPDFIVMARTDALASEGLAKAVERAQSYVAYGADMIFVEAVTDLNQYQAFAQVLKVPILANITEFGSTPLFTVEQLRSVGVSVILYPLSAFRAMSAAALKVYGTIREQGSQENVLHLMQTRQELYECLNYFYYEQVADKESM